jgi:hypothetical protein
MARRPFLFTLALIAGSTIVTSGCGSDQPLEPEAAFEEADFAAFSGEQVGVTSANAYACWGQVTQVFARMGAMGEHASQFETPRLGLRNLARALYEDGVLAEDSVQALGAFVADALGLSIEACL